LLCHSRAMHAVIGCFYRSRRRSGTPALLHTGISVTLARMFGIRVLMFLLGIGLVVWILIRLAKGPAVAKKPQKKVGDMVQCSHCGVYVPRSEAVQDGDRYFCCREHRDTDR